MNQINDNRLSLRLKLIVDALPLKPGLRILEIGCGSGAAAREIASRIGVGYVLGIDRSSTAISQAVKTSQGQIRAKRLEFRCTPVEHFSLAEGEELYDFAFAIRVGALDGRHPKLGQLAFPNIARALKDKGKLYIDGGNPLQEISLDKY